MSHFVQDAVGMALKMPGDDLSAKKARHTLESKMVLKDPENRCLFDLSDQNNAHLK